MTPITVEDGAGRAFHIVRASEHVWTRASILSLEKTEDAQPAECIESNNHIDSYQPTAHQLVSEEAGDFVGVVLPSWSPDEALQEWLEYVSTVAIVVPDRAGGVPHETMPNVTKVPLVNTDGLFTLIDSEDYSLVKRYVWSMQMPAGYAFASDVVKSGKRTNALFLHRQILMLLGREHLGDHINGDKLDNRKVNLRVCTPAQNSWNQRISKSNTTGVKGVGRSADGKLHGFVKANGVARRKTFRDLEAAKAWVIATRTEMHGEFACHGEREPLEAAQ